MRILGIDTSNYTTSAAFWQPALSQMDTASKLLPVPKGNMGLRQSEAVFHHTQALDQMIDSVCKGNHPPSAIGVSVTPRTAQGSYMPCFTVGKMTAYSIGNALHVPIVECSHQEGHIAAAAFGSGHTELLTEKFIAFHVSGGTTEAVLVEPKANYGFEVSLIATSLDLKAGQAVDRVGGMLALSFPAGKELDKLAQNGSLPRKPKATLKGADCSLSGIENQCRQLLERGAAKEDIARYCIEAIGAAISAMTEALLAEYGKLPLLYAGGVMSNSILQKQLSERFGGFFAPPAFSSDNAAGVAYLAALRLELLP
ncbi:MAG: peptidase M22 [Clostridia bacterium]|nr:peptidase M22 [Clostridia bacterium]